MYKTAEQTGQENSRLINYIDGKYNTLLDVLFWIKYLLFVGAFLVFAFIIENTPFLIAFAISCGMFILSLVVHLIKEYFIEYVRFS